MGQLRRRGTVWWVRYYRAGVRHEESAHSTRKQDAIDLLRLREGDLTRGVPLSAKVGQLRVDEALADVVADYRINGKRSLDVVTRRVNLHLLPYFGGRRMATITTADIRAYVAARQAQTTLVRRAYTRRGTAGHLRHIPETRRVVAAVSPAEINRELTLLKRAFSLAIQSGKLLVKPYIPLLAEPAPRGGFFEREAFVAMRAHLPADLRPVVTFAYLTGWRIPSEVLPLQWRQVDFEAGEVRIDPGRTKNGEGRVFPMTADLRAVLTAQWEQRQQLVRAGHIVPWVFFRLVAVGRRGRKVPTPIRTFSTAWRHACAAAGCPGRIPHDLRRTAIRNMVRAGVSERVAMRLSGHKTRCVFERYNITSPGDLTDAARRLDEAALGATGTKKGQLGLTDELAGDGHDTTSADVSVG
jgi:integrase